MFDHIMLKVKDLGSSKRYYSAALAPALASARVQYDGDGIVVFGPKDAARLVFVPRANRPDLSAYVAFVAKNRAAVKAFLRCRSARHRRQGQRQSPVSVPIFRQLLRRLRERSRTGNNIKAVCHQEE